MADEITQIKSAMKDGLVVVGEDRTMKLLRDRKIVKVFVASNASALVRTDVKRYAQLAQAEVVELSMSNEELGTLCKKPFSISILGVSA